MSKSFSPMLAAEAPAALKFPLYASPKLDGIRCLIVDGKAVTRSLKPIPNDYIRTTLEAYGREIDGFDSEVIVGKPTAQDCYNRTQSAVMRKEGKPDFTLYVFDRWTRAQAWDDELDHLSSDVADLIAFPGVLHSFRFIQNQAALDHYEQECLIAGYEGLILRYEGSRYKFGRSTAKEGHLLKLKRFTDGEAEVTGVEELMRNGNEAKTNALGRTERSSNSSGLVGGGTLGAFLCRDVVSNATFKLGTGFDAEQRHDYWSNQKSLIGRIVKYKSFKVGEKNAPRHSVFLGFRSELDL